MKGIVAAGHPETAEAACAMLAEGGNAFDAAVAALAAASMAEPLLASLGGGGFLLARPADGPPVIYDFFGHTPGRRNPEQDLFPIIGDFGDAQQEFHIGLGSIAVPGLPAGLAAIQSDLCRMPLVDLVQPAVALAKDGVPVNRFQALIARILLPIVTATPPVKAKYSHGDRLIEAGDRQANPALADVLETLAAEGARWFYEGEPASALARLCESGGHLEADDLHRYEVIRRRPLQTDFDRYRLLTNPVPSCGGTLITLTLALLERLRDASWERDEARYLLAIAHAMAATNRRRRETRLQVNPDEAAVRRLLDPSQLDALADQLREHPRGRGGTTHISVADREGNLAAVTVSNGEGCGHLLPGTGIHLNNFLGEEDLNPEGIGIWQPDRRMSSMMAPTIAATREGAQLALGSGGSNRLRTAIVQVLTRILALGYSPEQAVLAPRMHIEGDLLSIEPGPSPGAIAALRAAFDDCSEWSEQNLFFGGVHLVTRHGDQLDGAGDPRRGGVTRTA